MSDHYQDGRACPLPHHARGAEHLHGDLLEGEHRRPRLRHDRQEEADTLPQGIEAVNSTTLPLKLFTITSLSQIYFNGQHYLLWKWKFRNETQQLTASWTFYILMSWVWSLLCMSVTLDRGLDLKIKYTNEKVFVKIVILMLYIQMLLRAWQIPE